MGKCNNVLDCSSTHAESGGPIFSFSLLHGLYWFYPGLTHAVPVTNHCEFMPHSPSYPTLKHIMRMPGELQLPDETNNSSDFTRP